jgi:translation initiation factor 5A
MEKKIAELRDLKVGKYVIIDNEPCKVSSVTHSKPGKHGGAKARVGAIGIFDGQKRNLLGPVSQKIEVPIINKKTAQVLTIIKDSVQLMDMETYETFELEIPEDLKGSLKEGVNVLYMEAMGKKKILQVQ